jgi:hypothetical protein
MAESIKPAESIFKLKHHGWVKGIKEETGSTAIGFGTYFAMSKWILPWLGLANPWLLGAAAGWLAFKGYDLSRDKGGKK